MSEHWKPIAEVDGYEISSTGRCFSRKSGKVLRPRLKPNGYVGYALWNDGKYTHVLAHRAVFETFLGPINPGMQVNHLNGDKTDNRLENLEVCTHTENIRHYWRSQGYEPVKARTKPPRLAQSAERCWRAKLTWNEVREIRRLHASGISQNKIAKQFAITQPTVSQIVLLKTWVP